MTFSALSKAGSIPGLSLTQRDPKLIFGAASVERVNDGIYPKSNTSFPLGSSKDLFDREPQSHSASSCDLNTKSASSGFLGALKLSEDAVSARLQSSLDSPGEFKAMHQYRHTSDKGSTLSNGVASEEVSAQSAAITKSYSSASQIQLGQSLKASYGPSRPLHTAPEALHLTPQPQPKDTKLTEKAEVSKSSIVAKAQRYTAETLSLNSVILAQRDLSLHLGAKRPNKALGRDVRLGKVNVRGDGGKSQSSKDRYSGNTRTIRQHESATETRLGKVNHGAQRESLAPNTRSVLTAALEMYKDLVDAVFSTKSLAVHTEKQSTIDFQDLHVGSALGDLFVLQQDNLAGCMETGARLAPGKQLYEKPFLHQYHFHAARMRSAKGSRPMGGDIVNALNQTNALELSQDSKLGQCGSLSNKIQPWQGTRAALSLPESAPQVEASRRHRFPLGRSNKAEFLWKVAVGAELAQAAVDHQANQSRQLMFYKKQLSPKFVVSANGTAAETFAAHKDQSAPKSGRVTIPVKETSGKNQKRIVRVPLSRAPRNALANAAISKKVKESQHLHETTREQQEAVAKLSGDHDNTGSSGISHSKAHKDPKSYTGLASSVTSMQSSRQDNEYLSTLQSRLEAMELNGYDIANSRISGYNAANAADDSGRYPRSFKEILA